MATIIYGLADKRWPDRVRYVGKTAKGLAARFAEHLEDRFKHPRRLKCQWLTQVFDAGSSPVIFVLELVKPEDSWQFREKYWIAKLISENHNLTNSTPGGDGGWPLGKKRKPMTEEQKAILSEITRRQMTPEARAHLSRINRGRPAHNRGKPHTTVVRQKISAANRGKTSNRKGVKLSAATRAKMSASAKNRRRR